MKEEVNELKPEFLGVQALNFAAKHNSSNRAVMFSNHFAQRLVIKGGNEKRIQTGMEQEFAKYTFSVKMPEDGRIIKIIPRYPKGIGENSLNFNPATIVIYENEHTKEVDYFEIPYYASYHQFFGFKYDFKDTIEKLKPSSFISKDTIFADSPSVSENGGYCYGISLNMAFMSIPSVSEDAVTISRDVLDRLKFHIYETRVVEFGSSEFPLNLYGNKDFYKPFPEIGDYIREDGVLMMLRPYDNDLMPVDMSIYDTMEPDFTFDKGVYVRGGRGKVVDIKVVRNNNQNRYLPDKMCGYIDKYARAYFNFHNEIINTERQIRTERKKKYGDHKPKISPKLHRLIVESLAVVNHSEDRFKHNLNLLYRKDPIDEYRIEFVIEYEMTPTIGFKLTDCQGGKGVICKIEEPENMPVDEDGNRADVIMDAASVISRMNIGKLYEHYLGAAARDVTKGVCKILGIHGPVTIDRVSQLNSTVTDDAYNYLLYFYQLVSSRQYEFFKNLNAQDRLEHLMDIVNDGIYIYYPIDTEKNSVEVIKAIEKAFKPTYGPVTYVGDSGQRVTTKSNIRIAPLYLMLLDKIADDWSAVSSGRQQHFGVLSPMNRSEKFAFPFRNSPVRTIGETEGRIFAGYCGEEAIAEMMDRSNSPLTQRNMIWNILATEKPGNIDSVVDRNYVPLGGSKPLMLVKHMFSCSGIETIYEPETIQAPATAVTVEQNG